MEKHLVFWTKQGFNAIGQKKKKTGEPIMLGNWGTFISFVLNPEEGEDKTPTFYSYFMKTATIDKIKKRSGFDLKEKVGFGWLLIKIDGKNNIEVLDFKKITKGGKHPENEKKEEGVSREEKKTAEEYEDFYLEEKDPNEKDELMSQLEGGGDFENDLPF